MSITAIKLIFYESMSEALDTGWTGLFHVWSKNREGSFCQRGVCSSLGRVQTGHSFVEDNAGSLRSFNIFRQQAARAHLVIKSVWSANIADLDACSLNSATGAHTHTHTHIHTDKCHVYVRNIHPLKIFLWYFLTG